MFRSHDNGDLGAMRKRHKGDNWGAFCYMCIKLHN